MKIPSFAILCCCCCTHAVLSARGLHGLRSKVRFRLTQTQTSNGTCRSLSQASSLNPAIRAADYIPPHNLIKRSPDQIEFDEIDGDDGHGHRRAVRIIHLYFLYLLLSLLNCNESHDHDDENDMTKAEIWGYATLANTFLDNLLYSQS